MTIERKLRPLRIEPQIIATRYRSGTASPPALIVAGPTASGKSTLAMELAERCCGTIINADAMQVYRELRVLTARPSIDEERRVPHALYGIRSAAEPGSVAWWRGAALAEMDRAWEAKRLPILTGGTGLYLAALTQGLAAIPDPGPAARDEARRLLKDVGPAALHTRLAEVDPEAAARLPPTDSQRIARAWEIWRGTGRSLASWQALAGQPAPWRFAAILIDPPRAELRAAIASRLVGMLAEGAVEEVRALLALGLDPALPAMRAHGVPELASYLRGDFTIAEAVGRIELVTGQYTKRQATWFRHHQLAEAPCMHTIHARFGTCKQFSERIVQDILAFIEHMG